MFLMFLINHQEKAHFYIKKTYDVIPFTIDFIIGGDSKAQNFIKDYIENQED
jgi:hypothetical protein